MSLRSIHAEAVQADPPFPLPPHADIVTIAGKPCVRIRDERGQPILCPLTRDGRNYLRQSKCWYFKYRDGNGTVRRMKGFADLKSTEQLAAEMERKALGFVSESSTRRMNTPAARSLSI